MYCLRILRLSYTACRLIWGLRCSAPAHKWRRHDFINVLKGTTSVSIPGSLLTLPIVRQAQAGCTRAAEDHICLSPELGNEEERRCFYVPADQSLAHLPFKSPWTCTRAYTCVYSGEHSAVRGRKNCQDLFRTLVMCTTTVFCACAWRIVSFRLEDAECVGAKENVILVILLAFTPFPVVSAGLRGVWLHESPKKTLHAHPTLHATTGGGRGGGM